MKIIDFKCNSCGTEQMRVTFTDETDCHVSVCCSCCKKQHLQPLWCEMSQLEMKRFAMGKELNEDDVKGLLLEKAVSDVLYALKVPHNHNPFNNTYPCYQNKRPDITIESLSTVVECKNLSKSQIDHRLSEYWLDKNVTKRHYPLNYRWKIVVFSYKPRKHLREYLNMYGWRVYSLGEQILSYKQERKTVGKLVKRFYWLGKEYGKIRKPLPKEQTRLRSQYSQEAIPRFII